VYSLVALPILGVCGYNARNERTLRQQGGRADEGTGSG